MQGSKQLKRVFDFLLALFLLILLSPLILLTALFVAFFLGKPILFKQMRVGYQEKIFTVYKFRTMLNAQNKAGDLLPDAERLTALGKFLRITSLDELPQLLNVLKGEMSFVGPRPLLIEYLPLYSIEQKHRHTVKPGITGWAQINGRNAISWDEKFKLDCWYVENQSFWLDIRILLHTFLKVFKCKGINQVGSATMEKFTGNSK